MLRARSGRSWLAGWFYGAAALNLDSWELIRPASVAGSKDLLADDERVTEVGATDEVVAAASMTRDGSRIRLYARPIDNAHR